MLETLRKGSVWEVAAWSEGGTCQTLDFLEALDQSGNSDVDKLNELIVLAAERGPNTIRNTEKCKLLGDGIYEFKASGGSRLFWFYGSPNRVVICSHGVKKPPGHGKKPYQHEIERAKTVRAKYLAEQSVA